MHPHCHARASFGIKGKARDQRRLLSLLACSGTIFAIKRDIEHAHTELGRHLRLQMQAFLHAFRRSAVMITHGQVLDTHLWVVQNFAWVQHGSQSAYSRWATPACSSVSSFNVLSMRS